MRIMNVASRIMLIFAFPLMMTGCIMENLEECSVDYNFKVKAYSSLGDEELNRDDVRDIRLYIFDEEMRFIKSMDTRLGEPISIEIPKSEDIHVVGWGNMGGGSPNVIEPAVGDIMSDCFISLSKYDGTRSSVKVLPPDDLFRGYVTVTRQQQQQGSEILLPIYREVGSMTVTVRGLKRYAGFDDDDYYIVAHGKFDGIDFSGNLMGGKTAYHPSGSFVMNGGKEEYYVPSFNMLPTEDIIIDVYHGTELIMSVLRHSEGDAIFCERSTLTNVLIEANTTLDVSVSITDWGEETLWKEF